VGQLAGLRYDCTGFDHVDFDQLAVFDDVLCPLDVGTLTDVSGYTDDGPAKDCAYSGPTPDVYTRLQMNSITDVDVVFDDDVVVDGAAGAKGGVVSDLGSFSDDSVGPDNHAEAQFVVATQDDTGVQFAVASGLEWAKDLDDITDLDIAVQVGTFRH
jgi:hypothetical protein